MFQGTLDKQLKNVISELNEAKEANDSSIDGVSNMNSRHDSLQIFERLTTLTVEVENEKLQLNQDIELLYTYINKFILTSINTVL